VQAPAVATAPAYLVQPRAPWKRHHLSFRGTRILTALMLGWVGVIEFAFGIFAVPAANDLGRASLDAGLMSLLGTLAPFVWALGIAHVVAAYGVGLDRAWGFRHATWLLSLGVLLIAGGLVFVVAGRDPFRLVDGAAAPAVNGLGLLGATLVLYAIAGWGVRRIVAARSLV
jgi:hypothetical protein